MASSRGIILFSFVNLCVFAVICGNDSPHQGKECRRVQHEFSHQKIGSRSLVPDNKIHDSNMRVCFNGKELKRHKSCCTRDTELKYVDAAKMYLKDSLRSSNAYLKKLVMESLAQFQERILELLEEAQNRTSMLLTQVHNIPLKKHHGTVGDFFLDMEQYARRQHVFIPDSVQTFFSELFPIVFDNILSDPSVIQYDERYRSCLLQSEEEIQPFGSVPRHLTHKLVQAFQRARSFVNALSVITEAINSTDHIQFDQNCIEAATRLQYCRHCNGYVDVKPCRGFCLNVIGGCLATVSEISPAWDELISVVGSLTEGMKDRYSLEKVLNGIDTEISNGILQAMDDGPRIYNEVIARCQMRTRTTPTGNERNNDTMSKPRSKRRPSPTFSLMEQLESVLKKLMDSRGIYNRLASEICAQSILYEQDMQSNRCWSGHKVEQYTKLVPESSFIAQAKANPEVKVDVRPNYKLLEVKDKLMHMKKNVSTLLTDEQMQRDGPEEMAYSSGERRISNKDVIINDDEDLYDPSSGSGSGMDSDVDTRPKPPYTMRPSSPRPSSSGSTITPVSGLAWVVVALCYTWAAQLVHV